MPLPGKIILMNGASSAGKSTLAAALQARMDEPFWHYSIDHLISANVLPGDRLDAGHFQWKDMRPRFFEGFHASLPALAGAGNNLLVEHIVESAEWMDRLARLLQHLDVFFVGVHCPLEELERREILRGNRRLGEAKADFEKTHRYCEYDFEVAATLPAIENADSVIAAWKRRSAVGAIQRHARRSAADVPLPGGTAMTRT